MKRYIEESQIGTDSYDDEITLNSGDILDLGRGRKASVGYDSDLNTHKIMVF
ncbi:hypothetical protein QJS04_geneDACA013184 [Acorus gramineus]|uniref:Uncharacterized protein n=1 Tax=Acorus gramineus TaxID=55184 RepID=A0AAV9B9G7_ACOGR|nr:hypothetical protein QJS04_geneDACA013184 [Acorus gramineus]